MIIDIHAHTSNHRLRDLHTASANIETLYSEARRFGIGTIVLMATYFPLKGTGVHNLDLLDRIRGKPLFKAFGSLDVTKDVGAGLDELLYLALRGEIAGIKLYPGYQGFEPGDSRLYEIYDLAECLNLPVMFHGGELHHCCPPDRRLTPFPCGLDHCRLDDLQELARPCHVRKVARDFPSVKFVVSHLANPYFGELRDVMGECPNVFTDISGQFVSGSDEDTEDYRQMIVLEILKFLALPGGADRIMFGTDFPIQSYGDSIDLVNRLDLSSENREKIFHLNAEFVLDVNTKL